MTQLLTTNVEDAVELAWQHALLSTGALATLRCALDPKRSSISCFQKLDKLDRFRERDASLNEGPARTHALMLQCTDRQCVPMCAHTLPPAGKAKSRILHSVRACGCVRA